MKNTKIFVLVALVSIAGFAIAKMCCKGSTCEVAAPVESTEVTAPEVVAEVAPSVDELAEQEKAKKLVDDQVAVQSAQEVAGS